VAATPPLRPDCHLCRRDITIHWDKWLGRMIAQVSIQRGQSPEPVLAGYLKNLHKQHAKGQP